MKRRDAGRVLTFAVTGALLGGVGVGGCHHKYRGPYTNPGPSVQPPGGTDPDGGQPEPEPETPDHVNEGPIEDVAPPDPGPTTPTTNMVKQPEPPAEPSPDDTGRVIVDTAPEHKPDPKPDIEPSTMNIRKVEDDGPKRPLRVNTRRVADPGPPPEPRTKDADVKVQAPEPDHVNVRKQPEPKR